MVFRRDEKRQPVADRGERVEADDGEGKPCGEGGRGVCTVVGETDWCGVDEGSGRGRGDVGFKGEAGDAVTEVGVTEEGEVLEREKWEFEGGVAWIRH